MYVRPTVAPAARPVLLTKIAGFEGREISNDTIHNAMRQITSTLPIYYVIL